MAPGERTEDRHERALTDPSDVGDGRDAAVVQLGGGLGADAPQPLDRERVQERQLSTRRHDQQPVRLGDATRHLGEELRAGDTHRDRQAHPLTHLGTQPAGDLDRRSGHAAQPADIEEGLVDRQALDERRGVVEHAEHRLARLAVRRHPRRDGDGGRAQPQRLSATHRCAHPEGLGLVAGGQHDTHADDHRASAQRRVVALLDRRVERVEVGVQDRGLVAHEHMFPQGCAGGSVRSRPGCRPRTPAGDGRW